MAFSKSLLNTSLNQNKGGTGGLDLQDPETREQLKIALGMPVEEREKIGVLGRIGSVLNAFNPTDDIYKASEKGIAAGVFDYFEDIPQSIANAVTGREYGDEYDKKTGSDLLKKMGVENKLLKGAGGFAMDVLLDPTTYVTFGASGVAKLGGRGLTKAGQKLFQKSTKEFSEQLATRGVDDILKFATKNGVQEIGGKPLQEFLSAGGTIDEVAQELAKKKVDKAAKEGVKVFDEGGMKFAGRQVSAANPIFDAIGKAYIDPISSAYGGAKKIPGVAGAIENMEKRSADAARGVVKNMGDTLAGMFSRRAQITGNNARFNTLVDFMDRSEDYIRGHTEDIRKEMKGLAKELREAGVNNLEAIPYIIEDTPIDLIKKLPKEVQESFAEIMDMSNVDSVAKDTIEKARYRVKEERDLFALHNTSADKLAKSIEAGGMPVPSIAITKDPSGTRKFGDITLVGSKDMINPIKGAEVYSGDIWSPRVEVISKDPPNPEQALRQLENLDISLDVFSQESINTYLRGDMGLEQVKTYLRKGGLSEQEVDQISSILDGTPYVLSKNPDNIVGIFSQYENELKQIAENSISPYDLKIQLMDNAKHIFEGVLKKENKFLLERGIIDEPTDDEGKLIEKFINDIYQKEPPTAENITQRILQNTEELHGKDIRGAESTMAPARVYGYKKLDSIEDIRNYKDKLMPIEKIEKIGDKTRATLIDSIPASGRIRDNILSEDFATILMRDYDGQLTKSNLQTILSRTGIDEIFDNELPALAAIEENIDTIAKAFKDAYKELPSEYFEAKVMRTVKLDEFRGAVVPTDTPKEILDHLDEIGVRYVKSNAEGAERLEVLAKNFGDERFRHIKDLQESLGKEINETEAAAILAHNEKIFGDKNVGIVEKIITPDGQQALGKYSKGWIDIAKGQADPQDTYFHEAAHRAFDTFVDAERKQKILQNVVDNYGEDALKKTWGENLTDIKLMAEEQLAEDFIKFATKNLEPKSIPSQIKEFFEEVIQKLAKFTNNQGDVEAFYRDLLNGKYRNAKAQNVAPALKKEIKNTYSSFESMGKLKTIVDKGGVKKKVFQGVLTEPQIRKLKDFGIETPEDLVKMAKQKDFAQETAEKVTKTKEVEETLLTRMQAGKQPEVKKAQKKFNEIIQQPEYREAEELYRELQQEASYGVQGSADIDDVKKLVESYGNDPDMVAAVEKYEELVELKSVFQERKSSLIDQLLEGSKKKRKETFETLERRASKRTQIRERLGMTELQFEEVIKESKRAIKEANEKVERVAPLIREVAEYKNPAIRRIIENRIDRITRNTDTLIDIGAIPAGSVANYIGRRVTLTPSGKDVEEATGILGKIGGSMKSKLDPKTAIGNKRRMYDYLAELVSEGGETKITREKGDDFIAQLVDQLGRDEVKVAAAQEFKSMAQAIRSGSIKDANGDTLYKTIDDVINEIDVPKKLEEAVDRFRSTGDMPEQLKDYLRRNGYQRLESHGAAIPALKDVLFDEETIEVMTKVHKQFFGEENFNSFVKMYDHVHSLIKASQTSWFPAFHVRNMFSNVFTNFIEGVNNPKRYTDAQLIQKYSNALASNNTKIIKKLKNKKINLGSRDISIDEILRMAKYNGVIGNNYYDDLSEELLKEMTPRKPNINPLSQQFILTQKGMAFGSMVEDNGRLGLFMDRLARGDDTRSAALKVKEVLFDYSDLSDFEKNVMKRFIPYYTWARKNAELQMQRLVRQPGYYNNMLKAFDEIKDAFSDLEEEDREKLPEWAKEGVGILMGGEGNMASAITNFGLPHEGFAALFEDNPMNTLGIFPKTAIELGTGQNIFKGKAIVDDTDGKTFKNMPQFIKDRIGYREEVRTNSKGEKYTIYYVDPWAKYWINNIGGRTVSTASKTAAIGEGGDASFDLANVLTGMKRYEFDLVEEEEKRNREEARTLYDELLKMGMAREYTNQYIPAEQKASILEQMGSNAT